jgi:phage shock protein A
VDQDAPDPKFDAMTARLLRREALRRAAEELNTTSGPGLEDMLARISAEVTAEATGARAANESRAQAHANSAPKPSSDPATDPHGA